MSHSCRPDAKCLLIVFKHDCRDSAYRVDKSELGSKAMMLCLSLVNHVRSKQYI